MNFSVTRRTSTWSRKLRYQCRDVHRNQRRVVPIYIVKPSKFSLLKFNTNICFTHFVDRKVGRAHIFSSIFSKGGQIKPIIGSLLFLTNQNNNYLLCLRNFGVSTPFQTRFDGFSLHQYSCPTPINCFGIEWNHHSYRHRLLPNGFVSQQKWSFFNHFKHFTLRWTFIQRHRRKDRRLICTICSFHWIFRCCSSFKSVSFYSKPKTLSNMLKRFIPH